MRREWNECTKGLGGRISKKELKNYRSIALVNTVGKIFYSVLNKRLFKWVERESVVST